MDHQYRIIALNLKAQAYTRKGITPTEAANFDREAFLAFATEVEKVALKLKQEKRERLRLF